jgi:predicted amidohydrolase YtcJ
MRRFPQTLLVAFAPAALAAQSPPADLIVTAARIYTVDPMRPLVTALAARGGRVVYAGDARGAMVHRGPATRVLELPGRTIIPGMVDAHLHFMGVGAALRNVDLVGTRSEAAAIERVVARVRELRPGGVGEWIRGRGWNQMEWADTRFPTNAALSRAVPNNPVVLTRVDGHATWVNARALELARITASTPDPAGGRIIHNPDGSPSGVLVDRAMGLVGRVVPPSSREEQRQQALATLAELPRWGLTGFHDAGVDAGTIALYEELARANRYGMRTYVMIRDDSASLENLLRQGPRAGLYDGRLWVRAIKLSADGALGSRGALLLEDYSDEPGNHGLAVTPAATILRVAVRALQTGFQLNVHAIGDGANRVVLDAFEAALRQVPAADHRFRIEHAQVIHRQDIPRFAQLGVIPSMQGSHQTSDAPMAMNRLGWTRAQGAYAWRSLLNTGVVLPNGSDAPVEHWNPLISFHSSITRQDAGGWPAGGWFPAERMTREEALLSMTLWPAYAAFMEDVTGSLAPGKYADFVVLDQDIMTIAPERILDTRVLATYLGGTAIYEARP